MDEFEICQMSQLDIHLVTSLIERYNLGFWSSEALLSELGRVDSICLVAKYNKIFAGFLNARLIRAENIIEIYNIAVEGKFQRKGVASGLLEYLIKKENSNFPFKIFLEVRVSNIKAITFYLDKGFRVLGKRKRFYTDPVEDAFIMDFVYEEDKTLD